MDKSDDKEVLEFGLATRCLRDPNDFSIFKNVYAKFSGDFYNLDTTYCGTVTNTLVQILDTDSFFTAFKSSTQTSVPFKVKHILGGKYYNKNAFIKKPSWKSFVINIEIGNFDCSLISNQLYGNNLYIDVCDLISAGLEPVLLSIFYPIYSRKAPLNTIIENSIKEYDNEFRYKERLDCFGAILAIITLRPDLFFDKNSAPSADDIADIVSFNADICQRHGIAINYEASTIAIQLKEYLLAFKNTPPEKIRNKLGRTVSVKQIVCEKKQTSNVND